jgi:hypothetical protein
MTADKIEPVVVAFMGSVANLLLPSKAMTRAFSSVFNALGRVDDCVLFITG